MEEDRIISDTNAEIGVVFVGRVELDKGMHRYLVLYFPNETHSNTHGGSTITQAGLAEIFLKGGTKAHYNLDGRWMPWWTGQMLLREVNWREKLEKRFVSIVGSLMKQAKSNWLKALRSRDARREIEKLTADINQAKADYLSKREERERFEKEYIEEKNVITEYKERFTVKGVYTPLSEWMRTLQKRKQNIAEKKTRFLNQAQTVREAKIEWTRRNESLKALKASIVRDFTDRDENALGIKRQQIMNILDFARDFGLDAEGIEEIGEQLKIINNPWAYGSTLLMGLRRAGEELCEEMINILKGDKHPDISERTKRNRDRRKLDDGTYTPLFETGEFAESLEWRLI